MKLLAGSQVWSEISVSDNNAETAATVDNTCNAAGHVTTPTKQCLELALSVPCRRYTIGLNQPLTARYCK